APGRARPGARVRAAGADRGRAAAGGRPRQRRARLLDPDRAVGGPAPALRADHVPRLVGRAAPAPHRAPPAARPRRPRAAPLSMAPDDEAEVVIPGGAFLMGRPASHLFADEAEQPARLVTLAPFAIDVH